MFATKKFTAVIIRGALLVTLSHANQSYAALSLDKPAIVNYTIAASLAACCLNALKNVSYELQCQRPDTTKPAGLRSWQARAFSNTAFTAAFGLLAHRFWTHAHAGDAFGAQPWYHYGAAALIGLLSLAGINRVIDNLVLPQPTATEI